MRLSNRITKVQISYGKKLQILTTYAGLIEMIEKFETKSKALQEVKQMLGKNEKSASVAVNKLAKLMNALDQRNNILVTALLNGFLFWELRQIIKIESWKEEHEINYYLEYNSTINCSLMFSGMSALSGT